MAWSTLQKLPQAQFGIYKFPIRKCSVKGNYRRHVHEYWKVDGGDTEKGGRKLYDVTMDVWFVDNAKGYPNLLSQTFPGIKAAKEAGQTLPLVIPHLGTMQALAVDWTYDLEPDLQNGWMGQIHFEEDGANLANLDAATRAFAQGQTFGNAAEQLAVMRAANPFDTRSPIGSIFDSITSTVNAVLILKDQVELQQTLIVAKLEGLRSLCEQADKLTDLQDPRRYQVIEALHDIWLAGIKLEKDVASLRRPLQRFTCPRTMTILDCSIAIFRTSSRAMELLQMNDVDDAYAIQKDTKIKYYEAAV